SGCSRASSCAMAPPSESPTTCARSTPAASSTARASPASCRDVYGPGGASLCPTPRLSGASSRCVCEKSASCTAQAAAAPLRPCSQTTESSLTGAMTCNRAPSGAVPHTRGVVPASPAKRYFGSALEEIDRHREQRRVREEQRHLPPPPPPHGRRRADAWH